MIGVPKYDVSACIAYIIDQLKQNGFMIKYTHPNLIFISWKNWVPDYVRNEIKKQTGTKIDGNGNIIQDKTNSDTLNLNDRSSTHEIKGILKPNTQVIKKQIKNILLSTLTNQVVVVYIVIKFYKKYKIKYKYLNNFILYFIWMIILLL